MEATSLLKIFIVHTSHLRGDSDSGGRPIVIGRWHGSNIYAIGREGREVLYHVTERPSADHLRICLELVHLSHTSSIHELLVCGISNLKQSNYDANNLK